MISLESWSMSAWSWLLTYLVHSTILLSLAWCLSTRWFSRITSDRFIEAAWKTALVAGVFSATLQHGIHVELFTLQWDLASSHAARAMIDGADMPLPPLATQTEERSSQRAGDGMLHTRLTRGMTSAESDHAVASAAQAQTFAAGSPGSGTTLSRATWIGITISFIMALGLGWSALDCWRLRRWSRLDVRNARICETFRDVKTQMGVTRPVRLSQSPRVIVPIVFGLRHAEICLPDRAINDMDEESLRCVFAHELAHVVRHDMEWRWIALLLERVMFLQPLNRVARRHLGQLAEYGCDELAARRLGSALPIARCLTTVASWIQESARSPGSMPPTQFAASMAPLPSTLSRRVKRLMATDHADPSARAIRHTPMLIAIGLAVALSTVCIPVVSAVSEPITERIDATVQSDVLWRNTSPNNDLAMVSQSLSDEIALLESEIDALRSTLMHNSGSTHEQARVILDRLDGEAQRLRHAIDQINSACLPSNETTNTAERSR